MGRKPKKKKISRDYFYNKKALNKARTTARKDKKLVSYGITKKGNYYIETTY